MSALRDEPRLAVSPERPLFDEPIALDASGFDPSEPTTIRVRMTLPDGTWRSWATYETAADGSVDIAEQAPIAGTYRTADPAGLLWSMERISERDDEGKPAREAPVEVVAEQHGTVVATTEFVRVFAPAEAVEIERVDDDVVATLYEPVGDGPHPTALLLGGSDGGTPDWKRPSLLASRGYAVLALAYFDAGSLPERLEGVPLSYFRAAIDWIDRRETLRSDPIAAIGSSRGGELALLLGAEFPEIRTVIAYAPSAYVYQGVSDRGSATGSAWRRDGEDLPYLSCDWGLRFAGRVFWKRVLEKPISLRSLFLTGLRNADPDRRDAAAIPVEEIGGPVLVVSGGDDAVWPAGVYTETIDRRLASAGYDHPYDRLHAPANGHKFVVARAPTTDLTGFELFPGVPMAMGGAAEPCHRASLAAWDRTLDVLAEGLGD